VSGARPRGAIDCDVHCMPSSFEALLPYLDDYYRDYVDDATIGLANPVSYVPHVEGTVPSTAAELTAALDRDGTETAVLSCLAMHGVHRNPGYAAAFASAVNDWMRDELLSADPRLRAGLVVATDDVALAVEEIERVGPDPRFVQVLLPVRGDAPYGNRRFHPIYEAAERHGLRIALHAWGRAGHAAPPTGIAPSWFHDYASNAHVAQYQLLSLVAEGVFARYPGLGVVVLECGFAWLPPLLWRFDKDWKGVWREVPWVKGRPSETVREHVRLSTAPAQLPPAADQVAQVVEMVGPQLLLYASDHPHDHGEAPGALWAGLDDATAAAIARGNAAAFYGDGVVA